MGRCCGSMSPEALVCLVVILLHLLVGVIIALALEVRYGLYGNLHFEVMPGDMALLDRSHNHIFCRSMTVKAHCGGVEEHILTHFHSIPPSVYKYLGGTQTALQTNPDTHKGVSTLKKLHRKSFNLYWLTAVPVLDYNNRRVIQYVYADDLTSGAYLHQTFYLLQGSTVSMQLCGNSYGTGPPGFWFHIFGNYQNFRSWTKLERPEEGTECANDLCLFSEYIFSANTSCDRSFHNDSFHLNARSSSYYIFVFSLPNQRAVMDEIMAFQIRYEINHTTFNMSSTNAHQVCEHVLNCTTRHSAGPLLIDMAYYTSGQTLAMEDSVSIEYKCHPNVLLYAGIFCVAPVIILLAAVLACYCLCGEQEWEKKLLKVKGRVRPSINGYGGTGRHSPIRYYDDSDEEEEKGAEITASMDIGA